MKQEVRAYMLDAGEAILRQKAAFHLEHYEVTSIDVMLLAEVTVDGEPSLLGYADMDSTIGQANVDEANTQRQIELCRAFLRQFE